MLEKIPGYSATPNKSQHEISIAKTSAIDVASVTFHPSHLLWYMQLAIYSAMLVFSFIAVFPFLLSMSYAIPMWLIFVFFIGASARKNYRERKATAVSLDITHNEWRLLTESGDFKVFLTGDVLVWSWLIIIPVRENLTRKLHYLVALPDSMSKEDWRRLRVWLKTCLQNK